MDRPDDVVFYLDRPVLARARKGQHNFVRLLSEVVSEAGLTPHYVRAQGDARKDAATRPGYSLSHMEPPPNRRGMTFRRAYHYPFWQIEASPKRWEWSVALSRFHPEKVARAEADTFFANWQRRLFNKMPERAWRKPLIYMPLQGLLRKHRSFQACSPVEMVERTAQRFPDHQILVTLHPNETYDDDDLAALARITARHPQVEVSGETMERCLIRCAFVVTQNSSAAFNAFFFRKPVVLFGQSDFHHIAGSVMRDGEDVAFEVIGTDPDYAGYVWWFWQVMAINTGKDTVKDRIAERLRLHGWPV